MILLILKNKTISVSTTIPVNYHIEDFSTEDKSRDENGSMEIQVGAGGVELLWSFLYSSALFNIFYNEDMIKYYLSN